MSDHELVRRLGQVLESCDEITAAERRLAEAEAIPLDPQRVEQIVESVARLRTGGPKLVAGLPRAAAAALGSVLLLSAGAATVVRLWPSSTHSTELMGYPEAVAILSDPREAVPRRQSAQVQVFLRTRQGIRTLAAVAAHDPALSRAARQHLEELRRLLRASTVEAAAPIPLREPFEHLVGTVRDRASPDEIRARALDLLAARVACGLATLRTTETRDATLRDGVRTALDKLSRELDA